MDGDWPGLPRHRPRSLCSRGVLRLGLTRCWWYRNERPIIVSAVGMVSNGRSGAAQLDSPSSAPPPTVPGTAIDRLGDGYSAAIRMAEVPRCSSTAVSWMTVDVGRMKTRPGDWSRSDPPLQEPVDFQKLVREAS